MLYRMGKELRGLVRLVRIKHWIKNGLILLPLIFSGHLLDVNSLQTVLIATLTFSLVASVVYIINDIRDVEKDRQHKTKKLRPIASGAVRIRSALLLICILLTAGVLLGLFIGLSMTAWMYIGFYLGINVLYSFGLKNVPIIDIAILSAGFVLRVLFGAEILGIEVSSWLYLSVLAGALYLGLGKRRGEMRINGSKSRKVNEYYTVDFLDKNMYVSMTLLLVFYSLWAVDHSSPDGASITIPLFILVFMSYSLSIEKGTSSGDPVDVFISNKLLIAAAAAYMIAVTCVVYL